jgi:hypothetical protein
VPDTGRTTAWTGLRWRDPWAAAALAHQPGRLPRDEEAAVDEALRRAEHLARPAATLAFSAPPSLEAIDLPPGQVDEQEQARLRAVAALYLVAELEATGVVRAAEAVARLYASGALPGDIGTAGEQLLIFWRLRNQRFSHEERTAIYARMFGDGDGPLLAVRGGRNDAFEGLLIDFADVVYSMEVRDGRPAPAVAVALRAAGQALMVNLVNRNSVLPDAAASELVDGVQSALAIFKIPGLQDALGTRSLWAALQAASRRYLDAEIDIASRVIRGKSGMMLLAWLADVLGSIYDDRRPVHVPEPAVVKAAGQWMEATLALREADATAAARA